MFIFIKKNKNSDGLTLVAALLMLSLAAASVMLITGLIASQIRSSLNTVNAIGAYYAGESGIERGLYYLQYSRNRSDFVNNFDQLNNTISPFTTINYKINVATTTGVTKWTIYNLASTSPQHLDIIDPSGNVAAGFTGPGNTNYSIAWKIDNCFPGHASDRLETTLYSFKQSFTEPNVRTNVDICNCSYSSNNFCNYISYSILETNRYYRLSFRPIDADVKELSFSLGNNDPIKSQANIQVDGIFKNSRYRLSVDLPALSPVSDIFSYVIFSEEDLTKGL